MIDYCSVSDTENPIINDVNISSWLSTIISSEGFEEGEITYVFCNDSYLHKLNTEFLNHDAYTDIISFDYGLGNQISGEIYISLERVRENAHTFKVDFNKELYRVMAHGILHYCGYKDKTKAESDVMRTKEEEALKLILDV